MVEIVFLNTDFEEIESVILETTIIQAIEMIDKINEFLVEIDEIRLRHEKTGWIGVDFKEKIIEVQLNIG